MHLLWPRIFVRLIVPTMEATLFQRIPAKASCALTFKHVRMDAIKIPTHVRLRSEGVKNFLHVWIFARCEIMKFLRVFKEVEQLGWIHGASDKLPGPTADHHERGDRAFAGILSIDAIVAIRSIKAVKVWDEGFAVDWETLVQRPVDQIHECGKDIQSRHITCDSLGREVLWVGDQERDTSRGFEPGHLVPRSL